MTPSAYIANLKLEKPKDAITRNSLPEWVIADLQKAGGDIEKHISEINSVDRAQELVFQLKPRLAVWMRELLEADIIAFGEVEDSHPNAYVHSLGGSGYAVVLNSGLPRLLYRVARVLSTRFIASNESERESGPEFHETARLMAEVFWWLKETGRSFGPDYPIRPEQAKIASLLTTEAEIFLIAHEIGHVIDDASKHAHPIFSNLDPSLAIEHRQEHAADAIALAMVMELHNGDAKRDPFKTPFIYAGAEFSLQVYRILELLNFDFSESHPTATSRLNFIRSEMKRRCDSDETWKGVTALSSGIDALFSNMIGVISDPGEHASFFERQANQVITDLDRLLDRCSGGYVPNYMQFYAEAGKIFDVGYSHKTLERAAQIAGDFFAIQESPNGIAKQDAWVRFQKFKLLLAFAKDHMHEPARSLFLGALRMS